MKKLTAAQEKLLTHARKCIDEARNLTFEAWYLKTQCFGDEEIAQRHFENGWAEWAKKYHEEYKNGIVCVGCNSRTMYALASAGHIEIIKDSTGQTYGTDKIKVLNY
jgi:hypothetical protein